MKTAPSLLDDRTRWPLTLADRSGVWCVFCLEKIPEPLSYDAVRYPPHSLEEHHPLPQSTFRDVVQELLPRNFPVGWTVPAHKSCHAEYYDDGTRVSSALKHALAITNLQDRDSWARKQYDAGVYWLPMIMIAHTLRHFSHLLEPSARAHLIARKFAAGAGVRSRVHPFPAAQIALTVPDSHKMEVFNHLANVRANRGHLGAAREAFSIAKSYRHKASSSELNLVQLSYKNRRAQVERTVNAGKDAVIEARRVVGTAGYSYLTALLLCGWNSLSADEPSALNQFDELLEHLDSASWLYVAEALFGKACHALRFKTYSLEKIYQWLSLAQYIYVFLGLQGTPHTNLSNIAPVPEDTTCFPGHVIQTELFLPLSAEQRLELRKEAIGKRGDTDWLYLSLLESLSGERGSRARIAKLLGIPQARARISIPDPGELSTQGGPR